MFSDSPPLMSLVVDVFSVNNLIFFNWDPEVYYVSSLVWPDTVATVSGFKQASVSHIYPTPSSYLLKLQLHSSYSIQKALMIFDL